jgi:ribosomal protein L29
MRRNDVTQLRSMDVADLTTKNLELRKSLENARTEKAMGRLKNVKLIETLRRDIARVETALAAKGK